MNAEFVSIEEKEREREERYFVFFLPDTSYLATSPSEGIEDYWKKIAANCKILRKDVSVIVLTAIIYGKHERKTKDI